MRSNSLQTLYGVLWLLWVTLGVQPISSGTIRIASISLLAGQWAFTVLLLRKHRIWRILGIAAPIPILLFLALPGRPMDAETLSASYVKCLDSYRGSPYVWGGENRLGIDCSGLVRRGLIKASAVRGIREGNPAYLRFALYLWWHDCTARALGDGAFGLTDPLFEAPDVNSLVRHPMLEPGDLAVTADGVHVMAFLGNRRWIEADPGAMKVLIVEIPDPSNTWVTRPAKIVRWRVLSPAAPTTREEGERNVRVP